MGPSLSVGHGEHPRCLLLASDLRSSSSLTESKVQIPWLLPGERAPKQHVELVDQMSRTWPLSLTRRGGWGGPEARGRSGNPGKLGKGLRGKVRTGQEERREAEKTKEETPGCHPATICPSVQRSICTKGASSALWSLLWVGSLGRPLQPSPKLPLNSLPHYHQIFKWLASRGQLRVGVLGEILPLHSLPQSQTGVVTSFRSAPPPHPVHMERASCLVLPLLAGQLGAMTLALVTGGEPGCGHILLSYSPRPEGTVKWRRASDLGPPERLVEGGPWG